MNIQFTTELFPTALTMMFEGMAGIFIALSIIYLSILLLQKVFP